MKVVVSGESGAREAVQTMDWGIVIDEGFQDGVTTVFLIGQGMANDPPDDAERTTAARKLREIAAVLAAEPQDVWECPNGCENAKPAWWPAPVGGTAPPCSRCDAPLKRVGDGERRDRGAGPDLVSRMIDARDCLRAIGSYGGPAGRVGSALRWLDEGIEEGMQQRELYARLRQLVAGEPHVCSCGGPDSCTHGRPAFEDRCRYELALRSLVGVA